MINGCFGGGGCKRRCVRGGTLRLRTKSCNETVSTTPDYLLTKSGARSG